MHYTCTLKLSLQHLPASRLFALSIVWTYNTSITSQVQLTQNTSLFYLFPFSLFFFKKRQAAGGAEEGGADGRDDGAASPRTSIPEMPIFLDSSTANNNSADTDVDAAVTSPLPPPAATPKLDLDSAAAAAAATAAVAMSPWAEVRRLAVCSFRMSCSQRTKRARALSLYLSLFFSFALSSSRRWRWWALLEGLNE